MRFKEVKVLKIHRTQFLGEAKDKRDFHVEKLDQMKEISAKYSKRRSCSVIFSNQFQFVFHTRWLVKPSNCSIQHVEVACLLQGFPKRKLSRVSTSISNKN